MVSRERAEEILKKTEVLLTGHFLLTSGKHSNQYMQCARILQYPEYASELCKGLTDEFAEDNIDIVIGPATGGIILAYEMASLLKVKNMFTERENGAMALRRGFQIEKGQRVLIAEDVITTGGSVQEVIDLVVERGGIIAGVAVLVDRSMGKCDFGYKTKAAYVADVVAYDASECPICKNEGTEPIKPGSRNIS